MKSIYRKIFRISTVFLFVTIILLQPVSYADADVSVQDKEVLETVDKLAPIVEEIAQKLWTCPKSRFWKSSRPFT